MLDKIKSGLKFFGLIVLYTIFAHLVFPTFFKTVKVLKNKIDNTFFH